MSDREIEITDITNSKLIEEQKIVEQEYIPVQKETPEIQRIKTNKPKPNSSVEWFAATFMENELRSFCNKSLTNDQLKLNYRKFRSSQVSHSYVASNNFSTTRRNYNKGILFQGQVKPFLVSFTYSEGGKIVKSAKGFSFAHFEDCLQTCIDLEIADPRFFTYEQCSAIFQHKQDQDPDYATWTVPSKKEFEDLLVIVNTIKAKFNQPAISSVTKLYDHLRFPKGYGQGE